MIDPFRRRETLWKWALRPREQRTAEQWIRENLKITTEMSNVYAGLPIDVDAVPHARQVLDFLADPDARELHIMKSSAAAISTTVLAACVYYLSCFPFSILYLLNNKDGIDKLTERVVHPLMKQAFGDEFVDDPDQKGKMLKVPSGHYFSMGFPTAAHMRGSQWGLVILDEYEGFPDGISGTGESPLGAARQRVKHGGKIITISTPVNEFNGMLEKVNQEGTKTHQAYLEGDQRHFMAPCPHCKKRSSWQKKHFDLSACKRHDELPFSDLPLEPYDLELVGNARLKCEECGGAIDESHRGWMADNAVWEPTVKGDPSVRSMWLNDILVKLGKCTIADIARDIIKSLKPGQSPDVVADMERSRFAIPRSDMPQDARDGAEALRWMCGTHERGYSPFKPWHLGLLVDCQKGVGSEDIRFKWQKTAYLSDGTMAVCDWGIAETEEALVSVLTSPTPYMDGDEEKKAYVSRGLIDSGFRARGTESEDDTAMEGAVYPLVIKIGINPTTGLLALVPIKGRGGRQLPNGVFEKASEITYKDVTLPLLLINHDHFARWLYHKKFDKKSQQMMEPRFWLPSDETMSRRRPGMTEHQLAVSGDAFLEELSAERLGTVQRKKGTRWVMEFDWTVPHRRKNDWGDTSKMSLVLWHMIGGRKP